MQNIVHKIDFNLSQPNNFQYIHCVQGDYDSESVIATLYNGNQLYTIEGKAMLQGSTEDGGLVLQNNLPISDDKHSVTFTLTKEILSSSGDITVNIVLIDPTNNQKKSTFPMVIKCNPDITGTTPVSTLTTIQEYVERAENAAKESEDNKVTTDENVIKATEQANIATEKANESANSAKESLESAKTAQAKATESADSAQTAKEQTDIATTKAQEASSSATASANSANESATSASNAKTSETNAEKSATVSSDSASASADSATTSAEKAKESSDSATDAALSEKNAKASEIASKTSETNAKISEENASVSAATATEQAKVSSDSATASALSEKNAKISEVNSKTSENASKLSEENAKLSETASALSESNAKTSAATATTMADEASASAVTASEKATLASEKADEAALSAKNASTSEKNANVSANISTTKANEASDSATQANESVTIASEKASDATESANSASTSATNASKSETNAKNSADSASLSATNASTSETNAQSYATASSKFAQASATSEANAKQSATNAQASEISASTYASNASISATTASEKADEATVKATESINSATDSLTYANQSKDYRDQCKSIAQGLEGALLPMGTISFEELPTTDIQSGYMYNISNNFTSDERFKDGAGKSYTSGTNIYYTSDGLWDVLIGDLEKYAFKTDLEDHIGDKSNPHNVTKSQVGLGNVPNVATNDQTVTYTDSSTLSTLSSGEKMSVAFGKIKKAISDLISHISDTTKHITSSERTLWNTVSNKVDKADGKGLSTNDFTTAEKNKLNGIESGANKIAVDSALSSTSTNPVQNKVVNSALNEKANSSHSHSYNDLSNKPTLGTAASKTVRTLSSAGSSGWKDLSTDQSYVPDMAFIAFWNGTYNGSASNLTHCNRGAFGTAATANKGDFASASHNHSYNDLSNKPTIPTNTNQLTNGAGFITGITKAMVTNALGYTPPTSDTNTWIAFKGATTSAAGTAGYAPAPSAGVANRYLRSDGTWSVPPDTNTTYSNFVKSGSGAKAGLVPAPSTTAGTTKYLREDGTWVTPPDNNTTYSNMTGATSSAAGKAGLVPAPAVGKQNQYLRGDGTWATPTNTTYTLAGLMGSSAKGSATQPVYWNGSSWVNTTYTLGKSVPSNAVFTDTNTWRGIQNNLTSTSTTDSLSAYQGKLLNDKITTINNNLSNKNPTLVNYYVSLGVSTNVATGNKFCSLTLPNAGTYIIGGYVKGGGAWFRGTTDQDSSEYRAIDGTLGNGMAFIKLITYTSGLQIYYQNLTGSTMQYKGCTDLWAIKIS